MGKKPGLVVQWTSIPIQRPLVDGAKAFSKECGSLENSGNAVIPTLAISNPQCPIPNGIRYETDFVSHDEERILVEALREREFVWEGFDQRRRVQRYDLRKCGMDENLDFQDHYKTTNSIPSTILDLQNRLQQLTGHRAQHVAVEEFSAEQWIRSGEFASNYTVTTFESPPSTFLYDKNEASSLSWFVAQVTLDADAYQHINQPKMRSANCWTLKSPNHWADLRLEQRSLLIKTGDFLFDWRTRVAAASTSLDSDDPKLSSEESANTIILKFYCLPEDEVIGDNSKRKGDDDFDDYGYRPSNQDRIPPPDFPMPPLKDLLTLIITTSPIRSNPSTELLEKAMDTLKFGGHDFAYNCRKIIVCDGCRLKQDDDNPDENGHRKVSVKYTNVKQSMRNGIVDVEQAEKYDLFKTRLKELCAKANEDMECGTSNVTNNASSPFRNASVVELEERHGYGFALRHALRHCVDTQFVCVIQHDRTLMRPTPVEETVLAMWRHPRIKYVGMTMRSNLLYRDIFIGKYGRTYLKEFDDAVLRVSELVVSSSKYGPMSESTKAMAFDTDKLAGNINSLVQTYRASAQGEIPQKPDGCLECDSQLKSDDELSRQGTHQLILTPTLFWYDNIHICETAHYRDFIFKPSYKMVARGGFVEDKLSPVMKRTVERLGFRDGHSRFGCYLLDDASGMFFTGHLDGGSYLTSAAKEEIRERQSR